LFQYLNIKGVAASMRKKKKNINLPMIPKAFVNNERINSVLSYTLEEFSYVEQAAIYYYCYLQLSIKEISDLTELSPVHVESVLVIFSEILTYKLEIFKKSVSFNSDDMLPVSSILGGVM